MKFTLSWLKEHLETEASVQEIADTLTHIGHEVESVHNPADGLEAFRIARVLTAERHPQADRLQILAVDIGESEPLQVVCGAINARAGLVGVFAAPGVYVPGIDVTLKVASIRGIESRGMMCSIRELGLGDEHDGILDLPNDAPIGQSYVEWAGLNDPVFDVAITPDRQDCMGVRGLARDLATAGIGRFKPLAVPRVPVTDAAPAAIAIEDSEGCPAFFAQLIRGIQNGPSPDWMARRLRAIGLRPSSALVDITNYVMFDLGRPLHVYDAGIVKGTLTARKAKEGESVEALNGKSYTLDPSITVIADDRGVRSIAGILGAEAGMVSGSTTDVIIECAYFDPAVISQAGQKLGLASDARIRFERGVDPAFLSEGLQIASRLVLDLCGGKATPAATLGEAPSAVPVIAYDPSYVSNLAAMDVAPARQREILEHLGFAIDAGWRVRVPSFRRDVSVVADIVAEVVRIEGLDNVPSTPLDRGDGVARPIATHGQLVERRVRRAAAAFGMNEAVTWSFISEKDADIVGGAHWKLANPISEDMKVMRPSLLPGLLAAAKRNRDRGQLTVRLFEVGRRYLAEAERPTLGLIFAGERMMRDWQYGKAQNFDAFDAKAAVSAMLDAIGMPVDRLQLLGDAGDVYPPGRSGRLCLGPKNTLAVFGEIHPSILTEFNMEGPVIGAEIFLDAFPVRKNSGQLRPPYAPNMLQPVYRDFAFLLPKDVPAGDLVRSIAGADKNAIVEARIFDLFTGGAIDDNEKSLAIEVMLQPTDKSFTDAELQAISDKIVAAATKKGARLRA
ncbi:MAG: phenylalanine--tRNA ligase subunit beta [Zymomonas mobilis subsp. pomaceae]